jgi:RNA polymerase sigma-70 factor, ECF subfamily
MAQWQMRGAERAVRVTTRPRLPNCRSPPLEIDNSRGNPLSLRHGPSAHRHHGRRPEQTAHVGSGREATGRGAVWRELFTPISTDSSRPAPYKGRANDGATAKPPRLDIAEADVARGGMTVLVDGRVAGDAAFEKLLDTHHSDIHGYISRVVIGAAADDVSVETFLHAFRARRSPPVDTDRRAWLFTIATRLCRNHLRRARRRPATSVGGDERLSANRVRPQGATIQGPRVQLEAIIRRLPVSQRLAFTMRRFHDLGYDAIGASLGCSRGEARIHVFAALRRIRREFDASATSRSRGWASEAGWAVDPKGSPDAV